MTDTVHSIPIDRASPVPLYFQVAQHLEHLIESGELVPGTRLDNEVILADRLGLSRPTMRQAIQHLVDRGMLVRKRGVGTQVVHPQVRRQVKLTSLYDDLARTDQRPSTKVLAREYVRAPDEAAAALGVAPGTEVVYLERLRYARDEPLALLHNHLPARLAELPTEELESRGLYEILRNSKLRIQVATQTIGARRATVREARLLEEPRGAPLLTITRTAYDDAGRAVEYGTHVYRASRYSFELTLVER
ncbi:MAG: UTRA domain-containing protein [Streptosporangiales bacterium]|nr:UTRA domain-containing protein [Streptosporangiales bacterium]